MWTIRAVVTSPSVRFNCPTNRNFRYRNLAYGQQCPLTTANNGGGQDDPRKQLIASLESLKEQRESKQNTKFVKAVFNRPQVQPGNKNVNITKIKKPSKRKQSKGKEESTVDKNDPNDIPEGASDLSVELRGTLDWFREMPKSQKEELSQIVPARLQLSGRMANFNQVRFYCILIVANFIINTPLK